MDEFQPEWTSEEDYLEAVDTMSRVLEGRIAEEEVEPDESEWLFANKLNLGSVDYGRHDYARGSVEPFEPAPLKSWEKTPYYKWMVVNNRLEKEYPDLCPDDMDPFDYYSLRAMSLSRWREILPQAIIAGCLFFLLDCFISRYNATQNNRSPVYSVLGMYFIFTEYIYYHTLQYARSTGTIQQLLISGHEIQ